MLADAVLVAAKDVRIELRSRVGISQIAPFAVMVLVLFGFALDADSETLKTFSAGLFWVTVLFSALLAIQRSFAVEHANDNRDALRLSGLDPIAIFAGKAGAIIVELLALEVVLGAGIGVLYGTTIESPALLVVTAVVASIGIGCAGTLYGVLAASLRVRETILPVLLLPVMAPVLVAATRAFDDALGAAAVNGWTWLGLLALASLVYTTVGALAFGTLLEES